MMILIFLECNLKKGGLTVYKYDAKLQIFTIVRTYD
jgi:hypothetical protein